MSLHINDCETLQVTDGKGMQRGIGYPYRPPQKEEFEAITDQFGHLRTILVIHQEAAASCFTHLETLAVVADPSQRLHGAELQNPLCRSPGTETHIENPLSRTPCAKPLEQSPWYRTPCTEPLVQSPLYRTSCPPLLTNT